MESSPKQTAIKSTGARNYGDYAVNALFVLYDRKGTTRQGVIKYIETTYFNGVPPRNMNTNVKKILTKLIEDGKVEQVDGEGFSSGSRFKLSKTFRDAVKKDNSGGSTPKAVIKPKDAKQKEAKPKVSPSKAKSPAARKPRTPKSPKAVKAAKVVAPKSSPKKKAPVAAKKAKAPPKKAAAPKA